MAADIVWLTEQYRQPFRHYHDLAHIAQMFETAKYAKINLTEAQVLAIWFHDVIYDPQATDNEERSADEAKRRLKGQVSSETLDKVVRMIMDTKLHEATIPESQVFLDLDLSILGSNRPSYAAYMQLIRKEYKWLSYERYKEGRLAVLEKFLKKAKAKRLFYSLGEMLNDSARENIQWEIDVFNENLETISNKQK